MPLWIASRSCWVDAREQLRRFLEQRREVGESELVLDGMSVDEALRMIGAAPRSGATTPGAAGADAGDWRSKLRALDAAPLRPPDTPAGPARAAPTQPPVPRAPRPAAPPDAVSAPPPRATPSAARESDAETSEHEAVPLDRVPTGYVVGSAMVELFGGVDSAFKSLDEIARAVATCEKCPLFKTAKNPVPGTGNARAELMCVGEAPGETEDQTGLPFVGRAGELLTKILAAIHVSREDAFIANVMKHRPPGNRNPLPQEVEACSPYLVRQIELIKPRVIIAFGTFAAQTLLNTKDTIGKLRGRIHHYHGVPLIVTYHPAALLRNPAWKRPTWDDVKLARRILDRAAGA